MTIDFTKKLSSLPVLAPPACPDRIAAGVTTEVEGCQVKKGQCASNHSFILNLRVDINFRGSSHVIDNFEDLSMPVYAQLVFYIFSYKKDKSQE